MPGSHIGFGEGSSFVLGPCDMLIDESIVVEEFEATRLAFQCFSLCLVLEVAWDGYRRGSGL